MILSPQYKHLEHVRHYVRVNVFLICIGLFFLEINFFKKSIGLINVLKLQNNNYSARRYG